MNPRVCVIGAGASGLGAARALMNAGISVDVLEGSSALGGNWRYGERSGVAHCTHSNTTKQIMGFSEMEMPDSTPDYPHHTQLLAYLESYARQTGVFEKIRFNQQVSAVRSQAAGARVELETGEHLQYDAVCVATGHHSEPRLLNLPGKFDGTISHAKNYGDGSRFQGRRVLLIGLGASGADIAVDLSRRAACVHVSVRRGYHIVPKYIMGRPLDHFAFEGKKSILPSGLKAKLTDRLLKMLIGDPRNFGFPEVKHSFRSVSPTISQDLLGRIGEGTVRVKASATEAAGDRVYFSDGSSESYDDIILATGYEVRLPFLEPGVREAVEQHQLFKHVVCPAAPHLYFIGFVQPLGAFWPVAEAQAQWVAELVCGKVKLPSRAEMQAEYQAAWQEFLKSDAPSRDVFMQVDQERYLLELWRAARGYTGADKQRVGEIAPFTRIVRERIARTKRRESSASTAASSTPHARLEPVSPGK